MTTAPHNAVTWVEIPVHDLAAGMALHARLLDGPFERVPSPQGCTHLTLPDRLEDAVERCRAAGGRVTSEPVSIGFGRVVYAHDADGNSIGLVEPVAA